MVEQQEKNKETKMAWERNNGRRKKEQLIGMEAKVSIWEKEEETRL